MIARALGARVYPGPAKEIPPLPVPDGRVPFTDNGQTMEYDGANIEIAIPPGTRRVGVNSMSLTQAGQASPLKHLDGRHVLHWHGDTFDLPSGAALLASTALVAHQAFAVGSNIVGLQFHGETDGAEIERWLIGHACELAAAGLDPRAIRAATARYGSALAAGGTQMFADWLAGLDRR